MSEHKPEVQEGTEAGTTELLSRISPVALISVAVGVTLITLLAMIALLLSMSLSSDVSHLEDQMRKLNKTVKTIEQDMDGMRASLAATPSGEAKPKPAAARPTHIDTTDPASDCVVRSGSKGGLADCFK